MNGLPFWPLQSGQNGNPQIANPLEKVDLYRNNLQHLDLAIFFFNRDNGEERIRTSEGYANRFTVCPLWPLGYLPKNL